MVPRVGGGLWVPDDLLGIDAFAVDHGGDLAVAPARVEADAAAVHMPAHGNGLPAALRKLLLLACFNRKPALKHVVHELRVKGALAAGRVGGFSRSR